MSIYKTPRDNAAAGEKLARVSLLGERSAWLMPDEDRSPLTNDEDRESGIVDALTNLMSFARLHEIEFEEALRIARYHAKYEAGFDWNDFIV